MPLAGSLPSLKYVLMTFAEQSDFAAALACYSVYDQLINLGALFLKNAYPRRVLVEDDRTIKAFGHLASAMCACDFSVVFPSVAR